MKNSFSLKWSVFGVLVKLFKNVPLYLSVRHKLVKKFDARLLKNYESNGCYGSPPHIIKVKVIKEFVEKYHPKIFVETGTYYGDMVDSVSKNFDKIYSIELDPYLFKSSKKRFKSKNHIEIIQGDSSKKLKKVLEEINQPTLFWLDGHWSEGQTARGIKDTPILEELTTIFESKIFEHIIIIDDARCFGTFPSYPTLDELKKFVYDKKKNVEINVEFDSIRITPTNKFN
jgi:hypothetical protein